MLNNLNNENDGDLNQRVTSPAIVEEYRPGVQERIKDKIFQFAVGVVAVGATSALSFGICVGVTRDPAQCFIPAGLTAGMTACSSALFMYFFASFRGQLSLINQVARLESEIVLGIPASSVSPSAPELNSASREHSPRSSFDLLRGSSQNTTNPINQSNANASLVFSV